MNGRPCGMAHETGAKRRVRREERRERTSARLGSRGDRRDGWCSKRAAVALDGRRAVAVARAQFHFITFNDEGLFDSTEWDESFDTVIDTWTIPKIGEPGPVIDARARFVDRRDEIEQTCRQMDACV